MKTIKFSVLVIMLIFFSRRISQAQPPIRIVSGQISLNDFTPTEAKYKPFTDSLERNLKSNPNDTTSLFYRSLLYLQFNRLVAKPDLSTNEPAGKLLIAKQMSDRADSLKMKSFNLKVLRAQLCKELTYRYAPADRWRFTTAQLATRKQQFDYYKQLANRYYDELADLDKRNAYDYQRLKVK